MTIPQGRRSSTFTRLLRHGFTDPSTAERLLGSEVLAPVAEDTVLLDALAATADPDLALLGLVRLAEAEPEEERQRLLSTVVTAKPLRDRLLGVLGASEALGDHLARHPQDWRALAIYESADLHPGVEEFTRGSRMPPIRTRCASPTAAACSPSPPVTSAAPSTSPRPPPSWPTSPPPPSAPPWASPRRPRPRTPPAAGSPSSPWASAAATS